jgi:hypothetical protein
MQQNSQFFAGTLLLPWVELCDQKHFTDLSSSSEAMTTNKVTKW